MLGIDVGASKLALAIARPDGELLAHATRPGPRCGDAAADLAQIAEHAAALIAEAGLVRADFAAAGLALPGPIDHERGVVLNPPNLAGWHEAPVRTQLREALGMRVQLENDANAAALAEWRYGAGRGAQNVALLTMSTGVGVGLILDGRLHRGHRGRASELGHAPVEWGGEPCACGQRGCLEAYVGGAAWTRRLRALAPGDSRVCALAGARERVTPEHVLAAAGEGDAFALAELERFNRYLARGITTLCFAVAPQLVVLGTIAVAAGERLCFAPLRALVAEQLWPALREGLRIVPSELGERLPYYAGVCVAREGASLDVAGEGSSEAVARECETKTAAR